MIPIEVRCGIDSSFVSQMVGTRAVALGLSGMEIASVVVAADNASDYASCISRSRGYQGGGTHSQGGAGKTLPFSDEAGNIVCDLIFPRSVFEILTTVDEGSDEWLLYDYVLSHELSHVFDNSVRKVFHPKPLADFGVSIEDLAAYWVPVLLSEFAACFIAGKCISVKQYELIAKNSINCISSGMTQLGTYKCQVYWNILVEQSKIAGTSIGSSVMTLPEYQKWARIGPPIVAQLESFVSELRELNLIYPDWDDPRVSLTLTNRCLSLFEALKA